MVSMAGSMAALRQTGAGVVTDSSTFGLAGSRKREPHQPGLSICDLKATPTLYESIYGGHFHPGHHRTLLFH